MAAAGPSRELQLRCVEVSEELDTLKLVGKMRAARKDLLRRLDAVESSAAEAPTGAAGAS